MPGTHPIDELSALSRRFGPAEANEKLRLLGEISATDRFSARRIARLHDTLYFMRAYADDARVLDAVGSAIDNLGKTVDAYTRGDALHHAFLNSGIPGSSNAYTYSYAVLQRIVKLFPGSVEFDWDAVSEESPLTSSLILTVTDGEIRGLEDESVTLSEWLRQNAAGPERSDLEVALELFERSRLDPQQRAHVFDTCEFPVVCRLNTPGSGRCEIALPPRRYYFQHKPIPRERFPLKPRIVRPPDDVRLLPPREGRRLIDLSLTALFNRNLEIFPLTNANPRDVSLAECGRGVQVLLAGIRPEFRPALESDFFFLILKNGVPLGYGPASISFGCCEMGINLFPEFRSGEIRYIYSQLMRTLYHVVRVRYFFLTRYGMGENNPEALQSGAFWFYRKLGFKASEPDVEVLAREEEQIMRSTPGYRSPMSTLRKLSHTEAYFDLSGGRCRPLDFGKLGMAVSRFVTRKFAGRRSRAERECTRDLIDVLGVLDYSRWSGTEKRAMKKLAPVLCLIPGLKGWPERDRRSLAAVIKAKGADSEIEYARALGRLDRLAGELHGLSFSA